MKDTDIAWAAGLFEGEGTFCFLRGTARSVSIHMTDLDILEHMQELFGGSLIVMKKQAEHHKESWKWTLSSIPALNFIESVLPYLGHRRSERALEWLQDRKNRLSIQAEKTLNRQKFRKEVKLIHSEQPNLSQREIAKIFNVERSYISYILSGRYD